MEWIALKHALLSHLPVATGLLLPLALFASQRPGRGIRPWWTVARYLGWAGLLGTLCAFVSGFATGRFLALIPPHRLLPVLPHGSEPAALLFRHALWGLGSLVVGIGATWAMNRPRKDHESLGVLALFLGLVWSAALLVVGEGGYRLAHDHVRTVSVVAPAAPVASPAPKADLDPEARLPIRALDYASLEAIHPEPVKSPAHGGRWIRVWVSPEAAAAYRAGQPLPQGALVVLSSTEDRWGRPGVEAGPIHALEMKASGPTLTFYWARVPMERRPDFGGESRVYWRGQDAHLEACRTCHAGGIADPAQRSRWRAKRVVAAE
ncbi:MAG: hypothetical protein HXX12_08115 [Geothrix sp.]|uniref:hypothetical protein n=1 Tax=Geothrix sp. TaxID=1962974 RepID=UPI00181451C1|nr:hypothetical protein [Geothrix sp.]NWJ40922.1 hypothetical protein [Geothrix sp.]WIL21078.1 MAG: hypothetical protein QOZ81_000324 [Geothrix sp.]